MTKKKSEKKAAVAPTKKIEMTNIFKTTYFYWRYWIKDYLKGKVKARFVKEEVGYNGKIAVQKTEVDTAKKMLADYKTKNPDTKDLWW